VLGGVARSRCGYPAKMGMQRALMAIGGYHPVRGNLMCLLDVTLMCLLQVTLRAFPTICRVLLKRSPGLGCGCWRGCYGRLWI